MVEQWRYSDGKHWSGDHLIDGYSQGEPYLTNDRGAYVRVKVYSNAPGEDSPLLHRIAAALNASAQRDAERKLLERAVKAAKRYRTLFGPGPYANDLGAKQERDDLDAILAEYAALQAEVSDPTDADPK